MKKLLVGLLLIAGCGSPAVAEPNVQESVKVRTGQETLYLGDLHRYGYPRIQDAVIRDHLVKLGHLVCEAWDGGSPDYEVFNSMIRGGATDEQAAMVMSATRGSLCPDIPPRG